MTIHKKTHAMRIGLYALVVCLLLALPTQAGSPSGISQPANVKPDLRAFNVLSPGEGWILQGNEVYRTADDGATWERITPSAAQFIQAVYFSDVSHGWVVMSEPGAGGIPIYSIAITKDGGETWDRFDPNLFDQGDVSAVSNEVTLNFLDESLGWLMIKRATGSNFDQGSLFRTVDGGETWQRLAAPGGGPVYFASENLGWLVGGPQEDEIYRTEDGGVSWSQQHDLALGPVSGWNYHYYLPKVEPSGAGVLPALRTSDDGTVVDFYHSNDGGKTWRLTNSVHTVNYPTDHIPINTFDAQRWILVLPDGKIIRTNDRGLNFTEVGKQPDGGLIVDLQMADFAHGWAASVVNSCAGKDCTQYRNLVRTGNGGRDWHLISLPGGTPAHLAPDSPQRGSSSVPASGGPLKESNAVSGQTAIMQGQGFDKCEIATQSQLSTWFQESPYGAVNLYIGGSCRACANSALSASYLADIDAQGWKFIPTWVGPQTACYAGGCGSSISNDPATAYNQGVSEANAAINVAVDLGLAAPDGSGTVIYYDLESYSGDTTPCREAAKSFMSGWTARIRELGSVAGVYGSACSSYIPDFSTITNVPDVVWLAYWIYSSYNSAASVWDVACISNDLWSDHQRLRQYTGGHDELWGGVTLNIDSNAIDGVVSGIFSGGSCCGCSSTAQAQKSPQDVFYIGEYSVAEAVSLRNPRVAAEDMAGNQSEWQAVPEVELPSSPSYSIARSTFGMGGGDKFSLSYQVQGTSGQAYRTGRMQSVNYRVNSGYWAGSVCPTAEFAASPTISTDNSIVTLRWGAATGATSYNIYRGTTPFFDPTSSYAATSDTTWDDPDGNASGDPATNYTYIVKPVSDCGESGAIYRLGEFDFGLTPGQ